MSEHVRKFASDRGAMIMIYPAAAGVIHEIQACDVLADTFKLIFGAHRWPRMN